MKIGGGSIVNISSIAGFVDSASGHPAYQASKGAVRICFFYAKYDTGHSEMPKHGVTQANFLLRDDIR